MGVSSRKIGCHYKGSFGLIEQDLWKEASFFAFLNWNYTSQNHNPCIPKSQLLTVVDARVVVLGFAFFMPESQKNKGKKRIFIKRSRYMVAILLVTPFQVMLVKSICFICSGHIMHETISWNSNILKHFGLREVCCPWATNNTFFSLLFLLSDPVTFFPQWCYHN